MEQRYKHIVLRTGTFHTLCNDLAFLQDSEIFVLNQVLQLRHQSQKSLKEATTICVHKCIYEALMRMAWNEFLPRVEEKHSQLKSRHYQT